MSIGQPSLVIGLLLALRVPAVDSAGKRQRAMSSLADLAFSTRTPALNENTIMKKLILSIAVLLLALGSSQSVHAVAAIPTPDGGASVCLLALGLAGLGAVTRKLK